MHPDNVRRDTILGAACTLLALDSSHAPVPLRLPHAAMVRRSYRCNEVVGAALHLRNVGVCIYGAGIENYSNESGKRMRAYYPTLGSCRSCKHADTFM